MFPQDGNRRRPARKFGIGSFALGVAVGAALSAGVFLLVGIFPASDSVEPSEAARAQKKPTAERPAKNLQIQVEDIQIDGIFGKNAIWKNVKGAIFKVNALLSNASTKTYTSASCDILLVVEFANGKKLTRDRDTLAKKHGLNPGPSPNSPWTPKTTVKCTARTTPLEKLYLSFPIERAYLQVKVKAKDAFGEEIAGVIKEIPISSQQIQKAWLSEYGRQRGKRHRR